MSKGLKVLILFAAIHFVGGMNAQAVDDYESELLLKEALMESNGDYNKHKKKFNHEEFQRADQWEDRGNGAIVISHRSVTPAIQVSVRERSNGRGVSSQ